MKNEYLDYVQEKLEQFGIISFKKMFGGYGVYANKLCIGVIAHGELYFKGHNDTLSLYTQYDAGQFCYTNPKSNKEYKMNWWKVVDEIMEDDELLKLCYSGALKSANEANSDKKAKKS